MCNLLAECLFPLVLCRCFVLIRIIEFPQKTNYDKYKLLKHTSMRELVRLLSWRSDPSSTSGSQEMEQLESHSEIT